MSEGERTSSPVLELPPSGEARRSGMSQHRGLAFALVTTGFWGVWGAFAGRPAENGFPETLVYVVWALTMIPPAPSSPMSEPRTIERPSCSSVHPPRARA